MTNDSTITPDRWTFTNNYLRDVFGTQDDHLAGLMEDAVRAGLPDIAVSADVGRMLMLLTSMTRAKVAIEVGTLAGYSGIWLARGLAPDGKLITIELENKHADFAAKQFARAGVADRIEQIRGAALSELPKLAQRLGPGSVDVVFLDAVKTEYPAYWKLVRPLIAPGGLIMADNVLGGGDWWIDNKDNDSRNAADAFNRLVAGDDDFEAVAVPLRQGVLIARRHAK